MRVDQGPRLLEDLLPLPDTAGSRVNAHHGEILQGVFHDGERLRRGLVTLPCPLYSTHATFMPTGDDGVTVRPGWRTKATRAAELTLSALGWPVPGGLLSLTSDIPLSRGFGSSTADVTAAIQAVVVATGRALPPAAVAKIAVSAERASDSLVYGRRAVLFAHREGVVIEDLGQDLVPLEVLGFGTSSHGQGVNTLDMPPARYSSWEIEAFRPMLGMLRRAVRTRDAYLLGRVATASALLNQRHLRVPQLDDIIRVARECGAAGVEVAHSGDIAGLLFPASDPATADRVERAGERLRCLGITETWRFSTKG
ncbi:GHMP kinase [Nonomuraea sp. B10E15]|uniref:GHMP family kinase ATP-binding protein n=1 Tax=Nonomuraea sp. B10E15 TaxID=3153560 RepID=UPI00325C3DC9